MKKSKKILGAIILLVISFLISTLIFALVAMSGDDDSATTGGLSNYVQENVVVDRVTIGTDTFFINPIDTETVEIVGYEGSDVLHHVSIPEKLDNKTVVKISKEAFKDAYAISSVSFPKTIEVIEPYAFAGCLGLHTLTIPTNIVEIGMGAFVNCTSLETLIFAEGTSLTKIENKTFMNCTSLKNVTILSQIKSIGETAFMNCTDLTTLVIKDGVETIGSQAFMGCTKLEVVEIAASVQTFEKTADDQPYAFANCTSLYLDGIVCPAGSVAEDYFRNVLKLSQSAPAEDAE